MKIEKVFHSGLAAGDKVVSTTTIRDFVVVVTERGDVFRITAQSGGYR